ncbi:XAC0095 family protein [Dokdonella koreensis]|uniref:XAC0095-like domain-containing protein n=1 Tax=Dokdonella koreensis DS-123 TaxID=1300342 RepID=A0A160DW54_9GAMM|nr:hypothetical protein [Dokdonella koreensis]ANB18845.1 Hypothetical protein I596_2852 [Dokdonella koreensis DS-123]
MNEGIDAPGVTGHYRLPEEAYVTLLQTRDQLRLLELLAMPCTLQDEQPGRGLTVAPGVLAQCFGQLARHLDGCLAQTHWLPGRR